MTDDGDAGTAGATQPGWEMLDRMTTEQTADEPDALRSRLRVLEVLNDVNRTVAASLDLGETLAAVARGVVEHLGFGAVIVNLVRGEHVDVVAIEGPDELVAQLSGSSTPLGLWQNVLTQGQQMGKLRFLDGRAPDEFEDLLSWVPDIPVGDDPDAWHPLDSLFAPMFDAAGDLIGVLSVDIPGDGRRPDAGTRELLEAFARQAEFAIERARTHTVLADNEELFRRTFETTPIGMALIDEAGRFLLTNRAFGALMGQDADALIGQTFGSILDPADLEGISSAVDSLLTGRRTSVHGHFRGAHDRIGRGYGFRIDSSKGTRILIHVEDVTEEQRSSQLLQQRATLDPLTGLLNRSAFIERLDRLRVDPRHHQLALAFLDLDMFKSVNDMYGHAGGDHLLVQAATRMADVLRPSDVLARFGGDEFVLCVSDIDGPAQAIDVVERVLAALSLPVELGGRTVVPSASVGITLSRPGAALDDLLADADAALYHAKAEGRGRWELFESWMHDATRRRVALREQLRTALADQQFLLHYQAVVDLRHGGIVGYEALLRWQHPERGLLVAADFVTELFDSSYASAATDWVIERALTDMADWAPALDREPLWVSVNVPPAQFKRPDLTERMEESLRRHGLDPRRLVVEITEDSALTDPDALASLRRLHDAGVGVAIDDFGSGYSGLQTLGQVPADMVKLDRFFGATVTEESTTAIVRAAVALAGSLGLTVLAEGVETREQADLLTGIGVDLAQGFHFGSPAPLLSEVSPIVVPAALLRDDLEAEIKRLVAALSLAHDLRQVGAVAIQAAKRVVGVDAGTLALLSADGRSLEVRHAEGYAQSLVDRWSSMSVQDPSPIATAARTGRLSIRQGALPVSPYDSGPVAPPMTLLAAPVMQPASRGGGTLGAFGVSWSDRLLVTDAVSNWVQTLGAELGRRICELLPGDGGVSRSPAPRPNYSAPTGG